MSTPEEDFATLFEASTKAKRVSRGQTISGTIVAIGDDVAFVDVGGKGEAMLDLAELRREDGTLDADVGDTIQAVVTSTEGGLTLSRRLVRGAATDGRLEEAFRAGLAVEGKVEREIKGGYEIRIGAQRAFCPFSQIDIVRSTTPADHLGRVYAFKIIEYKENGANLIVSRRALLEEERRVQADAVRRSVVRGAVLKGHVASVRDFGAFVDLGGGVQGLLHVSEMGWSRVIDPAALLKPGDEISVMVLRVDEATDKIALGLKQLSEDPWAAVPSKYQVGQRVSGRVTRLTDFGAFVELEPGVEALAHSSGFAPTGHPRGWEKLVPTGTTATFEVLAVEAEKKRIGIALVDEQASAAPDRADAAPAEHGTGEQAAEAHRAGVVASGGGAGSAAVPRPRPPAIVAGARVTGKIERHEKFGVFVFLAPGRTGLMPMSETGVTREGDVARTFPVGSELEVMVLETDASGRRIRLSRKAILDAQEADEVRAYAEREPASTQGIGSLADKLRGAIGTRGK